MLKEFQKLAIDILFPKHCVKCNREGKYLCNNCELFISENALICPVCGYSSFFGEAHFNCSRGYQLNGLTSVWDYDGAIEQMVRHIKYGGRFDIVKELLGNFLKILKHDDTKRFSSFLNFLANDNTYITYVPMYIGKEKRRGFNQSKIIANELGRIFNKPVIDLLKKIGDTKEQAKLNKEERLENVKNTFDVRSSVANIKDVRHRATNILLVDDVFTTGATMRECCKVLKKNSKELEINKVWGFTLARTL